MIMDFLSPQQQIVVLLRCCRLKNTEIAEVMGLKLRTVRSYLATVKSKTGLSGYGLISVVRFECPEVRAYAPANPMLYGGEVERPSRDALYLWARGLQSKESSAGMEKVERRDVDDRMVQSVR